MKHKSRRKFLLFLTGTAALTIVGCRLKKINQPEPQLTGEDSGMSLEEMLIEKIKAGHKIQLTWDCGGDEAIVTTFQDEERINYDTEFGRKMDLYIINFLNLPDVGEFYMKGTGEIILEKGKLYLECESTMVKYAQYSENGEYLGWKEVNKREDMFSGKRTMFDKGQED